MASTKPKAGQMSDEAVQAKTGKVWKEWFKILDQAGAQKMNHKEIVAYLYNEHDVGPWWRQMVTVTYEQARGLREKHETATGFSMSCSKTLPVSLAKLYQACSNAQTRDRWLREKNIVIRKASPEQSIRMTWSDGKSLVELRFYAKGENKCQFVAEHNKLPNAKAVTKMKIFWNEAIGRLQKILQLSTNS